MRLEDHLLECLDVAVKAGDAAEKRRRMAMGTAAWDLLEKPWKGLLLVALDKEEPSGGEEGAKRTGSRSRRMRGGRGRRGRGSGTEEWLEDAAGLVASEAPPAYRLAALLVQRARMGDQWNIQWDVDIEGLRESCAIGVHPVWPRIGKEAPLLAEMSMYPELEGVEGVEVNSDDWVAAAKFDPKDRIQLSAWLAMQIPFTLSAELELGIQRLSTAFSAKGRAPRLPNSLDELEGEVVLIRALARIGASTDGGEDDLEMLAALDGPVSVLAANHLALLRLRDGDSTTWSTCRTAVGEDGLSAAMRQQAWSDAPEDADLSSTEIQTGLDLLKTGEDSGALRWSLVAAQLREGAVEAANETVASLNLGDASRLPLLINLLRKSGPGPFGERMVAEVTRFGADALGELIELTQAPSNLRAAAARELHSRGAANWESCRATALDLFTEQGDADYIGLVLMEMEGAAAAHPYRSLLVHHLLPAHADPTLCEWVASARPVAIAALAQESSGVLSDASIGLIKLLEGAPANLASIHERLDRNGIQAFNQCRRAMMEDGDGLVAEELLETLQISISTAEMTTVENRLYQAVLASLRFNRALRLLEYDDEDNTRAAETTLDDLISDDPRMRIVEDVRQIVLEHGVAVPSLAEWHRMHAASSAWHLVVLASIDAGGGNGLAAARGLRRASRDTLFDFENRVRIARRALIAFAHAGQWSEAVEMLEDQPALQSALTGLFQLYLHVCDDAKRDQSEAARGRILDWIARTEIIVVENSEGERVEQKRTTHPSDELDILFTYPNAHRLPQEPWQGRIRAAIRGIRQNRRSQRSQLEARFRHTLADNGTVQEIEMIADEAAGLDSSQGLMMFERAMNANQFSPNEIRNLRRSQHAVFALNQANIPIRARRKLRHLPLKPLLLVDTNLLIDAAKERIGLLLDDEAGIDARAHGTFHRTVLAKANNGQLHLFIPNAALNEFNNKMCDLEKVRGLFNDVWMNEVDWVETVTRQAVDDISAEIIEQYGAWQPPADENFSSEVAEYEDAIVEFLTSHSEIYHQVADIKSGMSVMALSKRTEIDGVRIYPESGDQDIMRTAAKLANESIRGIGSVLVATRDSDFCLVRRALEESFGFGVVRSARELAPWL